MTQHPDLTIHLDASVIDDEALRALRAVQRSLPQGDGGGAGNSLVGGIATVAVVETADGKPDNGWAPGPQGSGLEPFSQSVSADAKPVERLNLVHENGARNEHGRELGQTAPIAPSSFVEPHPGSIAVRGAAGFVAPAADTSSESINAGVITDAPDALPAMPPPVVEIPSKEPEEQRDTTAELPIMHASDVAGQEDGPIRLDLMAALRDTDGSETISVVIMGVPEGAVLSHGTRGANGSWSVELGDLANLAITPSLNFSGDMKLTLRVTTREANGDTAVSDVAFTVHVEPVADAPVVIVTDAHGMEDEPIRLDGLGGALRDTDGSEVLSFVIAGVPAGATLSAGQDLGGGRWALTQAQLGGLALMPPENGSGSYTLRLEAIASEREGRSTAGTAAFFTVTVDPVVDAGSIGGTVTGSEDTQIVLQPVFSTVDRDGSEKWAALTVVSGVPAGASLSGGREINPGTWEVATADLQAGRVTILPSVDSDADILLTFTTTLTDSANGTSSGRTVTGTYLVDVAAVADAPIAAAADIDGREDQLIVLDLTAGLKDADGSETLSVSILGVPEGASLSRGTRGTDGAWHVDASDLGNLVFTPPKEFSGTIDLTLRATSRETSNGSIATTDVLFHVQVDGVANAPEVAASDVAGTEDHDIALDLSAAVTDKDGSEELYAVSILGLPAGAKLSHGKAGTDGAWIVEPADLHHLVLTPPPNYSGTLNLTVEVTAREGANGSVATTRASFEVTVDAVADAPELHTFNALGNEDTAISLHIEANLTDADGSEVLSVRILNVPEGARLSHATHLADGAWRVSPADLPNLTITPPKDFSGTIDLIVETQTRESSNGSVATTSAPFQVEVRGVADAPDIVASGAAGNEDAAVPLNLSTSVSDKDGSEHISDIVISGVPDGFSLTHGTSLRNGDWSIDPAELGLVSIVPPRDFSGTFDLVLRATSKEDASGSEATTEKTFQVRVEAVADRPEVSATSASGTEDKPVALKISANLTDTDGSETLSVVVGNLPDGARLSAGVKNSDGTWTLTPSELPGLTITPPGNWSGTRTLTVQARSRESSNGSEAINSTTLELHVEAVADAPKVAVKNVSGNEDQAISLNLSASLVDVDGSETLSVVIVGVPATAMLSHGTREADGTWSVAPADLPRLTLTPSHDFSGRIDLKIRATSRERNGDTAETEAPFSVVVTGVADAPTVIVANARGLEDAPVRLDGLGGALRDTDGSEALSFVLSGLPKGSKLNSGAKQSDGTWLLTPGQLSGLTMTPPANASGEYKLTLTAVATETVGGSKASTPASFTVRVDPVVDQGKISGSITGSEDTAILLQPKFSTPDADGSETWSALTQISGVPAGARLSRGRETSDGTWEVSTADLKAGRVTITPPDDSDADFTLTVTTTLTDTANGVSDSRIVTGSYVVAVNPVADAPEITVENVSGLEDEPIALKLEASLADIDGSETLSVFILGVPKGAHLSVGTLQSDGSWKVSPSDLEHLTLTPPKDFSGTIELTLKATSKEGVSGPENTAEAKFEVHVEAVADTPGLRVSPAVGDEDTAISLHMTGWTTDIDKSESLVAYHIRNVPVGAVVEAGGVILERQPDGSVFVDPNVVGSLKITPPPQSGDDFVLQVSAISREPNGSEAESAALSLRVNVHAVADTPALETASASGSEDTHIALKLLAVSPDRDGSESYSFVISKVPDGFLLSEGTYRGHGVWSLTADEAARVTLLPPRDYSGTVNLAVTTVSQEGKGGDEAVSQMTFPVHVVAVVDKPAVGGLDGRTGHWGTMSGPEDRPIRLNLDPGLSDRDGSEHVVGDIVIGGIPFGAILRLADGSIVTAGDDGFYRIGSAHMSGVTLTMPHDSDVKATLSVQMIVEDKGGVRVTLGGEMVVDPTGVADNPNLILTESGGAGHESIYDNDGWIRLDIKAQPADVDGSESLTMWVRDVPSGATLSAGIPAGDGLWLVPVSALPTLAIRPAAGFVGSISLRVTAVAHEREGDQTHLTENLTVVVAQAEPRPVADPDANTGATTAPPPSSTGPGDTRTADDRDLYGTDNNDTLFGHTGENRIYAGGGDDIIYGYGDNTDDNGNGHDEIYGQKGNDTLAFGSISDLASTQVVNGGDGTDTIRLLDGVDTVADSAFQTSINVERLELQTTGAATVTLGSSFLRAFGSDARIEAINSSGLTLEGAAHTKSITVLSGAGSDIIKTGSGNDRLDAGAGDDLISAGAGNDTIIGGSGSDSIDGGDGADRLVYSGDRSDYTVKALIDDPEGYQFSVTSPSGSVDKIRNIEFIDFADYTGNSPSALIEAPTAQKPVLLLKDQTTAEDQSVALSISASTANTDHGRETLGIRIDGVPDGAHLSAGTRDPVTGSWVLHPNELSGLTLAPPADFAGTITLTVRAVSTEVTGSQEMAMQFLHVHVGAVADNASISAAPGIGAEDQAIPLNLSITAGDRDGSENITAVLLSNLSPGVSIADGVGITNNGDGTWSVDPANLASVRVIPSLNSNDRIEVTVTTTAQETSNGNTRTTTRTIGIDVAAVADQPNLTVHDVSGQEDKPILLDVSASLTDADGSEVLSVVITGLPEGSRLSKGVNNGDGSWTLTPSQLAGLILTPPGNWSGTTEVTVLAHALERSNGSVSTRSASFELQVDGDADIPVVSARDVSGREDTAIPLTISAVLVDRDGSETLSAVISNLPDGATFSHGRSLAGGGWSVDPADIPNLTFTPPGNFSGRIDLILRVTATEKNGDTASSETPFAVMVAAVADAPTLTVADSRGHEDSPVRLDGLGGGLSDADGSETLSFGLSGVPAGAVLSAGVKQPDGSWLLTPAQLSGLTMSPPSNESGTYTLTLTGTASERSNNSQASTAATFTVTVDPVADTATIGGLSSGAEDTLIVVKPTFTITDLDGSEQWAEVTQVSGVPTGATLTQGREISQGVWEVSTGDLKAGLVSIRPAPDSDADFTLTIRTTLTDSANGMSDSRVITGSQVVSVSAVADVPLVGAENASGYEDQPVTLNFSAALKDLDGSETLSIILAGVPSGAKLSAGTDNHDGTWTLPPAQISGLTILPPKDFSGSFDLVLRATAREASGGSTSTAETVLHVEVGGVADAPLLTAHDTIGTEDHPVVLDLTARLADVDGSEQLSMVTISGLPEGFTFSHGASSGEGTWSVPADSLAGVKLIPAQDWSGTLNLTLEATSTEMSTGATATRSAAFTVTIEGVNDAPELTPTAATPSEAGVHHVDAVRDVGVKDIDSQELGGATVTLTGAHPGDRLDFDGYSVVDQDGRTMIGDTGIEVVGGGYDASSGALILSGSALPETYAAVLKSIVLESENSSGLDAGIRSVSVTLFDDKGAASRERTVDAVIEDPLPAHGGEHQQGYAAFGSGVPQASNGAEMDLAMSDNTDGAFDNFGVAWTDQVNHSAAPVSESHSTVDFDQPAAEQIQGVNDYHIEIGRMGWS